MTVHMTELIPVMELDIYYPFGITQVSWGKRLCFISTSISQAYKMCLRGYIINGHSHYNPFCSPRTIKKTKK